jgi:endonuclease YncB( thermonuclease family)
MQMLQTIPPRSNNATVAAAPVSFGFCRGREGDNCVIDGDSFILQGETIRLAPIDAPELGNAKCARERALGERAERRLHQLLNAGLVKLERSELRNQDRFGRLLRDAVVNGRSVSEQLLEEGLAQRWEGQHTDWC